MIDKQSIHQLNLIMTRIFAMPLSRITFREIQSAYIGVSQGNIDLFNNIMESILSGQLKPSLQSQVDAEAFTNLIEAYSLKTRIAKDVHDKAQFISFITSDVLSQPNGVVFSNCIKTVEGEEKCFLTDVESTIQLIQHFIGRLHEASKIDASKEKISKLKSEIDKLKLSLDALS